MHIERIRQIDASEPDESGMYDYYYEYDLYRFTEGDLCLVARSYTDEPDEVHFLRTEEGASWRPVTAADLSHPLSVLARSHLRSEGKVHIRWLSGKGDGYEPVPAAPEA